MLYLQEGTGCEKEEKCPVAADNLHLIWDTAVKQQCWIPDPDPSGMASGFSVSFLRGDVFMEEVVRHPAKGAREVELETKAEGTKHQHCVLWPRLLIEYGQCRERRY